jgi:hypothetical protein
MPDLQTHNDENYEPTSRDRWLDQKHLEFDCKEDKREAARLGMRLGVDFWTGFTRKRDALKRGGLSVREAWRRAIVEVADQVPSRKTLRETGEYTKSERQRAVRKKRKAKRDCAAVEGMSRIELHRELAGKKGSVPGIEWVAEHLFAEVDILALDPADIPSRTALNMLEWAKGDQAKFWDDYDKHEERKARGRTSLSDSGRSHVEVTRELFAERDVLDAMMGTADVAVGVGNC